MLPRRQILLMIKSSLIVYFEQNSRVSFLVRVMKDLAGP